MSNAGGASITALRSGVLVGGTTSAAATIRNAGTITGSVGIAIGAYDIGSNTIANSGAINGTNSGINVNGAAGSVTNSGTVSASGSYGIGIFLDLGGNITNGASGSTRALISGEADGIMVFEGAGIVTNGGTVTGAGQYGAGIDLDLGGGISNGASGATGALIAGSQNGINVYGAAGTVTNYGTIAGSGGAGIYLGAGGTIVNFGTISGANGTAISLGQAGGNAVVIEAGSALDGAISGFPPGDTVDLPCMSFSSNGTVALRSGNALQIAENSSSFKIDLDPAQNFAGDVLHLVNDGNGGTLITEDPPGAGNLALLGQFAAAGFATTAAQGSGAVATYVLAQPTPTAPRLLTIADH